MLATRPLLASGQPLDPSPEAFGFVRSSADALADPAELNRRLEDDGYLYLPGFFDSDLILAARRAVTDRLAAEGSLDPAAPTMEAVARPDRAFSYRGDLARDNAAVSRVVYGPELLGFYQRLFGEPVRHYDHTWFRAVSHGQGTPPHCDLVYMSRGTHQLLTAWIPYGEVPLEVGGLILLEDSHHKADRIKNYLEVDVDLYCENNPKHVDKVVGKGGWSHPGWLTFNPTVLRERLGGRWLTATPSLPATPPTRSRIEATYSYVDAAGVVVANTTPQTFAIKDSAQIKTLHTMLGAGDVAGALSLAEDMIST